MNETSTGEKALDQCIVLPARALREIPRARSLPDLLQRAQAFLPFPSVRWLALSSPDFCPDEEKPCLWTAGKEMPDGARGLAGKVTAAALEATCWDKLSPDGTPEIRAAVRCRSGECSFAAARFGAVPPVFQSLPASDAREEFLAAAFFFRTEGVRWTLLFECESEEAMASPGLQELAELIALSVTRLQLAGQLRQEHEHRLKLQEELKTSEQYVESLLSGSADCVKLLDLEGHLLSMNLPGQCVMEVEDMNALRGGAWPNFWPENLRGEVEKAVVRARSGETVRFHGFCPTAKGSPRCWDVVVAPVRDHQGAPWRLLSVSRDVTDLALAEERYRSLVTASAQVVWRADASGNMIDVRLWQELTGRSAEELQGTGWIDAVHTDERVPVADAWHGIMASGSSGEVECRIRRKDGEYRWFLIRAVPVHNLDGTLREWVGTCTDRHEQRLAEEKIRQAQQELHRAKDEAVRASRIKSQFLANMSHELRTPLNAIIGYAEMLIEEANCGDDSVPADLEKIHTAGKHLLGLINEILDLSKIEAGRMELQFRQLDVREVVAPVVDHVRPLMARNDNQLQVQIDSRARYLYGDEVRLKQILVNLLGNAGKFTTGGTVTLNVTCDTAGDEKWVLFQVRDTGIGMSADEADQLFQEFTQVDASATRKHGGSGLGLAISRRLARLMKGEISVESSPGAGSTFTLHLPQPLSPLSDGAAGLEESGVSAQQIRAPRES